MVARTVIIAKALLLACLAIVATGLAWGAGPTRDVTPGAAAKAAPEAAAISLSKTVGTTPGVCAPTSSITVAAGTEVYYCFQVENTGDETLNFHDLVDDQLGVVLDELPYTLAPGAFSPEVIVPATHLATVTNNATWTAVTTIAGYGVDDTITYDWQDISATGTAVILTDDSVSGAIPIGFSFDFFGTAYSNLYISSNGFITFTAGSPNGCCTGQNLPNTATPNNLVAGWWEDLNPSGGGTHHYQTLGSAPNRVHVVQVTDVPHFGGGNLVSMQYKLFETTNTIEVHYQAAPSDGGTHTAGIENAAGTIGVMYYHGTAGLSTPVAVRYALLPVESAASSASATVTVQAANIDVSPLALGSTQLPDTTAQRALTIANTGDLALDWVLVEEPVARPPEAISAGDTGKARETIDPSDFKEKWSDGVVAPASAWRMPEALLYDNGPLVTHPGGGAGGADASALQTAIGLDTYGFGYQLSAGNRIADDFTVTGGGWFVETVTFFGYQTGSTTTSTFNHTNLRIWDGPPDNPASTVVFGDTSTNRLTSSLWTNAYRVLDTALTNADRPIMANMATVNQFLPAGTYWLDWQAGGTLASGPWAPAISILGQTTTGNALQWTGAWAALVDTGTGTAQGLPFVIEGTSDCSNPADVPWLAASPTGGTTAPASSTPVTVTFDSTGLGLGTYEARLCIASNDPNQGPGNGTNLVIVPATLTVSSSAPGISVSKTVGTTPGVCAASSNITVAPGTTVYYCYTVTNTGDVAFALHDLVDDQLGTILTGLNYALAPGASVNTVTAGLSISAVINVATTNVATWTAYNSAPGDGAQAQATAVVQVSAFEPQSIPTLSELGLLALVLLLAVAGVLVLRRLV